jgi:8-oxo-dGTP pyrophosphatase MutT (NUDIX family)
MPQDRRILAEGKFLRLVVENGWEWVERRNTQGAVVIAAITEHNEIVLIEQYRIPLAARVIELPAGLAGDEPGSRHEALIEAARRELLEETGYFGSTWITTRPRSLIRLRRASSTRTVKSWASAIIVSALSRM